MDEEIIISLLTKFGFIKTSGFGSWEKLEGNLSFHADRSLEYIEMGRLSISN